MKDEKFYYKGGSLKSIIFRVGASWKKNVSSGELSKGSGVWAVCRFKRGTWWKRRGGVFEGGMIPQCTLQSILQLNHPCCSHCDMECFLLNKNKHCSIVPLSRMYTKNKLEWKKQSWICTNWSFLDSRFYCWSIHLLFIVYCSCIFCIKLVFWILCCVHSGSHF